jgi:hypothetical protein
MMPTSQHDSIGHDDPTVRMPMLDLSDLDLDLESTVVLERLPAFLRRQAE